MTLSVCLIVKDEQQVIARCLNCASKFADEIIVVDTGSSDNTVSEVKKFTDKVYFFKWCYDFSAARNFAFEKATCDLVMWLDADDVVTDENCAKINVLKNSFADYDMAVLQYAVAFDKDRPTFVYNRERIFRRSKNYRFSGAVHEAVVPKGKVLYSDAVIYHKKIRENEPMRNLRIYQNVIAGGAKLDARQKFYYGRELFFNKMYREAIAVLKDFLKGDGWSVNKAEACLNIYQAYRELGEDENAYAALLKSLTICPPTSQVCCILGEMFFERGEYLSAAYWYKCAMSADNNEKSGAFINRDFCDFIPLMQLCVIYDRLGNFEVACDYNERAGKIKPHNANYLSNVKYFESIGVRKKS